MEDREAAAWLGRKIGWGLTPGQLDRWSALGPQAVIDLLVDPDAADIESRPDPFAAIDLDVDRDQLARLGREGIVGWIGAALS